MAKLVNIESNKTYANEKNCLKAVEKLNVSDELRFFISYTKEGRCFPIFIGQDSIQYGIHFHFPVVA